MGNAIAKNLGEIATRTKAFATAISPYVALELFVPGGTVLAILLFLHRRKAAAPPTPAREETEDTTVDSTFADHGAAQPFATMCACGLILLIMLAA